MSSGALERLPGGALERLLARDRVITLAGIAALSVLAWAYLVYLASRMDRMDPVMAMPRMEPWSGADVVLTFVMWSVMMVAMMVPSAAPVILLVAAMNRRRREQAVHTAPTPVFVLGYVLVWAAFSALAALAQWGLHSAALLSPMMTSTSSALGGGLLIAAGLYQWTPFKLACLTRCRSPIEFLSTEWREGVLGALQMGVKHGGYCVGCCFVLMTLLFVAGVMNLLWVAAIGAFVLVEKLAPGERWVGRAAGLVLVAWGVGMVV